MIQSKIFLFFKLLSALRWQVHEYLFKQHLLYKGFAKHRNFSLGRGVEISIAKGGRLNIGQGVRIDAGAHILVGENGLLEIGNDVYIGKRNVIAANQKISIGPHCLLAHGVTIIDTNHRYQDPNVLISAQGEESGGISLDSDIWVAANAILVSGTILGRHCVVGAGSVVNKAFGSNLVVAGAPAKIVKELI